MKALGRFVHETAVTDPATGILYLTEDDTPAGFFRFVPNNINDLTQGGSLEMLKVKNKVNYDTRKHQTVGAELDTEWVQIPNPDPDLESGGPALRVTNQGKNLGAALFDYLEGADFKNGEVTFASAYGGDNNHGQIWRFIPATGKLKLLYEAKNRDVLDTPDNVSVSPRGGVLICEDGHPRNFLRGLTEQGEIFDFAENIEGEQSEFSGPVYTPDNKWLIVSIMSPGITVAITGPWGNQGL